MKRKQKRVSLGLAVSDWISCGWCHSLIFFVGNEMDWIPAVRKWLVYNSAACFCNSSIVPVNVSTYQLWKLWCSSKVRLFKSKIVDRGNLEGDTFHNSWEIFSKFIISLVQRAFRVDSFCVKRKKIVNVTWHWAGKLFAVQRFHLACV